MNTKYFALISLLLPFTTTPSFSEEIGRAQVNGQTVVIDSDGSWKYDTDASPSAQADCTGGSIVNSKKLPITLCIAPPWKLDTNAPGSMEMQVLNKELDVYFGLITERTPIPLDGLRKAILYNAAQGTGVREEDINIVSESKQTIGGHEWSYIEYDVVFSGAKYRFANYYSSLGDAGVVQGVFWCANTYFEQNKPTIAKFMDTVALKL